MDPYFYINSSDQEEQRYVAKFLKILESLGEHTASLLFQKGVVLGDDNYKSYEAQLVDEKLKDALINMLLRPGETDANDNDIYVLVAVLLLTFCHEATQIFLDIESRSPDKPGTRSGIIALGRHLALIDRATVFLNLPSVNDKVYWRLITAQPAQPTTAPPPVPQNTNKESANKVSSPNIPPATPEPSNKQKTVAASSTSPVAEVTKPTVPIEEPKQATKKQRTMASSASSKKPAKKTKKVKRANNSELRDKETSTAESPPKPDGPVKAMLRRVVKEIHDNSYDAVINALKDNTFMMDLYNARKDPITVKVVEVDTNERLVYLIKRKRGPKESVSFMHIRKTLSEL